MFENFIKDNTKESNAYLRVKKAGCAFWGILVVFALVGILITIIGIVKIVSHVDGHELKVAIIGVVAGLACILLVSLAVLKIFRDYKKHIAGIEVPSNNVWDSGVLTDKVIRQHVKTGKKDKAIIYISLGVFFAFMIGFTILVAEEPVKFDIKYMAATAIAVVCLALGIKEIISRTGEVEYVVEEDKVSFVEKGSVAPAKSPSLTFLKYRDYTIDPTHFHSKMAAFMIAEDFEVGEEVYMVYSRSNHRLIHIYRKKYWSRA